MKDKTLYIHIGCHKTGTTSIQHTLALNESALCARGLSFYYRDFSSGENKLPDLHSWLRFSHKHKIVPEGMRIRDASKLASELDKIKGDVIISSENFAYVFDKTEISSLHSALTRVFPEIKIICYIRRQDRHIISHHQEGSKLHRSAEYDLYGHSTNALPLYNKRHALYLDYNNRLSMWADVFGDQNIIIKVYERKELLNGDVVADFFQLLNVSDFKCISEKNVSLDLFQAKLGHLINASQVIHKNEIFQNLVPKQSGSRKLLPSRDEAIDYYRMFRKGNILLNSRFGISNREAIFDDDFDSYPDCATDLWDEDTANEAILSCINGLDELYKVICVDDLRDAAISIERTNVELSYRMMSIAHRLRPQGLLINQKLSEYRARLNIE